MAATGRARTFDGEAKTSRSRSISSLWAALCDRARSLKSRRPPTTVSNPGECHDVAWWRTVRIQPSEGRWSRTMTFPILRYMALTAGPPS